MSYQSLTLRSADRRDPGHVIGTASNPKAPIVSGTVPASSTTPITLILDMTNSDHFSLALVLTGTITAAVKVEMSNCYNPNNNDVQDESTALYPGKWIDTSTRYTSDFTAPAGSSGSGEIHGTWVEAAFLKVTITPDGSGAGQIDGYLSGKSA